MKMAHSGILGMTLEVVYWRMHTCTQTPACTRAPNMYAPLHTFTHTHRVTGKQKDKKVTRGQ